MMKISKGYNIFGRPRSIVDNSFSNAGPPLVSICCITYNHQNYIKSTIEGFLSQKTSFPIEIIIHDDASSDNTANILKDYKKKYPTLINLIIQEKNQWSKGGGSIYARFVFPLAKGKYIAICEGDDYWTDQLKLQKQVQYLEDNTDYGLVFTDYNRLIQQNSKLINSYNCKIKKKVPVGHVFDSIIYSNPYVTCTSLFLAEMIKGDKFNYLGDYKYNIFDKALWLEIAAHKKIGYLPHSTATYRVHSESISNHESIDDIEKFSCEYFKIIERIIKHYKPRFNYQALKNNNKKKYLRSLLELNMYKEFISFKARTKDKLYVLSSFIYVKFMIKL